MDDDRIFGCLPGETPTSIVLLQQERRHHEALAAAQSRIEDLLAARANDDAQFAKDRKRIAELERMVVFLVREANNFDFWHETQFSFVTERLKNGCYMMEEYSHDGTPASILAAVEKAMGDA